MTSNINAESAIGLLIASFCIILSLWVGASPDPPEMLCDYTGAIELSYMQMCGLLIFAATTINLVMVGKRALIEFM
jgi:hypothetical protein